MDRESFETLVNSLEIEAKKNPNKIRGKTKRLVITGYLFLGGMLFFSIGIIWLCIFLVTHSLSAITIKFALIGFPAIAFAISLILSLRVKMVAPEGIPLDRKNASKIFAMLDELSDAAIAEGGTAVQFDKVLLTPDFNAAVVQIPRLGIFGWHTKYLILGLPLMESVSSDEFKAVLAHEFAHLSGQHGRFGNWIYRTRMTWEQLVMKTAESDSWGNAIIRKFLNWFWPRLNGHAFALSRGQEYEADAFAGHAVSIDSMSRALQRIEVVAHRQEAAWDNIRKQMQTSPTPPDNVYNIVSQYVPKAKDENELLSKALCRLTDTSDTHPSLTDRLNALGITDVSPTPEGQALPFPEVPAEMSAAACFLDPDQHADTKKLLSEKWSENVKEMWELQHKELAEMEDKVNSLPQLTEEMTHDKKIEVLDQQMRLLLEMDEPEKAEEVALKLLDLDPRNSVAHMLIGQQLLTRDNEKGVSHINTAMEINPIITDSGLDMLYAFYNGRGDGERLEELKKQADAHEERMEDAGIERNYFSMSDPLGPHGLTEEDITNLGEVFKARDKIAKVYAVTKITRDLKHLPMIVFALDTNYAAWKLKSDDAEAILAMEVAEEIELQAESTVLVFAKGSDKKAFAACESFSRALIWERAR